MENVILLVRMVAVVAAAIALGNWFMSKVRQLRAAGLPVYYAYLSTPGIIILLAILVPIILRLAGYL